MDKTEVGAPPTITKIFKYIGIVILVIILAISIYLIAKKLSTSYYKAVNTIPTPENNALIVANQSALNANAYNDRSVVPVTDLGDGPEDRRLINYNMLGCRITGYIGPAINGIFDENVAVAYAIKAGCRVFLLPIGTMTGYESPVLVARALNGDKISNNFGTIRRVCEALAEHAPLRGVGAEPIIIILYFEELPGKNPYDPVSVKFMRDVAAGLAPLKRRMLGMTPQGDYRRQAMQDVMMLRDRTEFDGKVIVMTNVDTKAFREPTFSTESALDLDLLVHARLYSETSTNLGITARPDQAKVITPRIETFDYFNSIPDNNLPGEVAKSKVQWTVALNPNILASPPKGAELKKLLDERGVSCLMVDICSNPEALFKAVGDDGKPVASVISKKYFGSCGFRQKPKSLRYKQPEPIELQKLNKAANANGGGVIAPKV